MEAKCELVRDLLPLYIEDLCSDSTRRIVDDHISSCEDCARMLDQLTQQDENSANTQAVRKEMNPFRKIQRRNFLVTLASVISTMIVVVTLCVRFFAIGAPASTAELTVTHIEMIDNMTFEIELASNNGNRLVHFRMYAQPNMGDAEAGKVFLSVNRVFAWPLRADNSIYKTSFGFDEGALGCDRIKAVYLKGKDDTDVRLIWQAE